MNTYILLEPTTRIDDDAVHWFYGASLSERQRLFYENYMKKFDAFNIVKVVPHDGSGSLEGYFIIQLDDSDDIYKVLMSFKETLLFTDEGWGKPHYYFAAFKSGVEFIEQSSILSVGSLKAMSKRLSIEIIKSNDSDDFTEEIRLKEKT